ncbi:MAG: GNAT family N-acetyltransferase [Aminipila sp.]
MKIREYRQADQKVLFQLFYNTVHEINCRDYNEEQINTWAPVNIDLKAWNESFLHHHSIVVEKDNEIVGFADMDRNGYLDRLFVHKDYQGIGIATMLLENLENYAKENGILSCDTYASITAKPFFEKRGFIVERENIVKRENVELINYKMSKKY